MTKKGITSLVIILVFSFCRHSKTPLESLYPRQDLMLEYQDDWGRNNYKKIIKEFKKNPLEFDDIVF